MAARRRRPIPGAADHLLARRRASRARPTRPAPRPTEIAAFVGTAAPEDFALAGDTVVYSGPAEWSLRRMVLHCAWLCKAAGGVDAFLIGSELRGLTTHPLRCQHLSLRRGAAGSGGGREDACSARGRRSPMPPTGASISATSRATARATSSSISIRCGRMTAIDMVGIDNYMPLADWRDGDDHLDAGDLGLRQRHRPISAPTSPAANISTGTMPATPTATRRCAAPISDGTYGKPWVFRPKDIAGWWANQHYDRPGGVEQATPTGWVAEGKPIWFTETGCPAVDKGAEPAQRLSRSEVVGERPAALFRRHPRRPHPAALHRRRHRLLEPGRSRFRRRRQPGLHGLWRAHGGPCRHPSVDLGRAALSGLSAARPTSGRTAPTGRPATGSTAASARRPPRAGGADPRRLWRR